LRKGFSVIELLVVLAVLAVIFAIGAFNGRRTLLSQEQAAFLRSLQGLFWEAATEAASRGENLVLHFTGQRLEVRRTDGTVLRALDLPPGVSLSLTQGVVARFTPPGKVADRDGMNLRQPLSFTATVGSQTYTYTVSLIGETEVVP